MPPRKHTTVCERCKIELPREAFDLCCLPSGRIRLYTRCRECRAQAGWYGGTGRPALVPPNPSGLCMCGCGRSTNIARRTLASGGYVRVKGHPVKYITGHAANRRGVANSWVVNPDTGCWEWQRATDKHGRGVVTANRRVMRAHRWVYEMHVGPIPEGLELDHLCVNPICVNPAHMEPVTHEENFRRDRMRRQLVGRIWLEMRRGNHAGLLRLDDTDIARLEFDGGDIAIRTAA